MLVPLDLQLCMLGLPLIFDIGHWILLNKSLKTVLKFSNENNNNNNNNKDENFGINDEIIRILRFSEQMDRLSSKTLQSALFCQVLAFCTMMINPYLMNDTMIQGLSLAGIGLTTISPMTPLMFTLATHEFIFKDISTYVMQYLGKKANIFITTKILYFDCGQGNKDCNGKHRMLSRN